MRKSEKIQFFSVALFPKSHGGENGGIKGSEGSAKLIVLHRFERIGGIQGKKQADRRGSVGRDGTEHKREIESGPWPRFSGQILDGDENRQGWNHGRGRHGGKKHAGPRHQKGGQEQTQGGGDDDCSDPGAVHIFVCSGEPALGEGEAD